VKTNLYVRDGSRKKAVTDDGDSPAKNKRALSWQNSADKQ